MHNPITRGKKINHNFIKYDRHEIRKQSCRFETDSQQRYYEKSCRERVKYSYSDNEDRPRRPKALRTYS